MEQVDGNTRTHDPSARRCARGDGLHEVTNAEDPGRSAGHHVGLVTGNQQRWLRKLYGPQQRPGDGGQVHRRTHRGSTPAPRVSPAPNPASMNAWCCEAHS